MSEPVTDDDKRDNSDNITEGERATNASVAALMNAAKMDMVIQQARQIKPIILAPLKPDMPLNGPR